MGWGKEELSPEPSPKLNPNSHCQLRPIPVLLCPPTPHHGVTRSRIWLPGSDEAEGNRPLGLYSGMKFFLRKAGHRNPEVQMVPDGTVAEFPIASVSQEDGGSYTCEYQPITAQNRWSYPSDPIKIIVGGEGEAWLSVPAPSPTPSQTLGGLSVPPLLLWLLLERWGKRLLPLHPASFATGVSALMGRSEPRSALNSGPSRRDAWPGSGDRVTGGSPTRGFGTEEGGIPAPRGSCRAGGAFPRQHIS
uniref:Ig-like domain-containing protein n=1 Tax=Terrapene triunguis TaxID=2587831 RepID=A0A674J638_9SAUR